MKDRIRWFALHGVVRRLAKFGLRTGDPQARLLADPVVRQDPAAFADECRARGPVIRCRVVFLIRTYSALMLAFDPRSLPGESK